MKEKDIDFLKKSKKEGAVIIISDIDFLTNKFAFQNSLLGTSFANDNATLFLNAAEALTGSSDLIKIRSRGRISRNFDVVDEIEFNAKKKTEKKVGEIQTSIATYQAEINRMGRQASQDNIALLQDKGVRKRKELSKKIALLKKELRRVKREGREEIEKLGDSLKKINTLFVPLLLALIGLRVRHRRKKTISFDEV